jgi:hypothetical protein
LTSFQRSSRISERRSSSVRAQSASAWPISRLDSRSEYRRWRRDEQVQAAIELKLAVARLRVKFSHPDEEPAADVLTDGFYDFSEVNAAMARVDLVGGTGAVDAVADLRAQLREFVRSTIS